MTTKEIKERLKALSEKPIIFPKYLMHQPNGSFKETHLVNEYEAYKGPKMIVMAVETKP